MTLQLTAKVKVTERNITWSMVPINIAGMKKKNGLKK